MKSLAIIITAAVAIGYLLTRRKRDIPVYDFLQEPYGDVPRMPDGVEDLRKLLNKPHIKTRAHGIRLI